MGLRWNAPRRQLLERSQREQWRNLYLGSGGRRQDRMINLDITPVTGPDVVGDGYCLPFADGTFDAIFCEYVIEHVDDPEAFIKAASSALKTGGSWYFEAPFLQPIHADGVDFTRWTKRGFAAALARCDLEVVQSGIHTGPAYALFWTIKDTAALTLSGGYQPIYLVTRYILAWLLWPLMLADFLLLRLPAAEQLASGYYFIAVKKSAS
jgi:SAM-dependent methyltransferase